jgi:hypothetical protein
MFSKYRYFLAIILISVSFFTCGQYINTKKDTIFVYDTIVVYDTIYHYDTLKIPVNKEIEQLSFIEPRQPDLILLRLDTANKKDNLLIISENLSATFPINSIIINENIKNLNSMKKLNFFGVVLFAFQSMVIAQTDFGFSFGGDMWWAECNKPIVKSELSPSFNAGLYFEHSISNHLFLKTRLNYHYLLSNYSYKAVVDTVNWILVGEGESATDYHQISIPIQIGYNIGKFKPYIGFEYSYRISESWLNRRLSLFGCIAGLNYKLSEKFSMAINYYYGLTKDYKYSGTILNPVTSEKMGEYNNYWKSSRIGIAFYYSIKKKKKENQ